MDHKIAGLLGAVGALASIGAAQASTPAAPTDVLKAQSYADLLKPIPNASATLEALDRATDTSEPNVQLAQFYIGVGHHHHHHHHHGYRRFRDVPRIVVGPRRFRHHHHHHHHHSYRRFRDDE